MIRVGVTYTGKRWVRVMSDREINALMKKLKPGRPVSTNSAANPLIRYRVSDVELADLEASGAKRNLSANQEAKRRAFPQAHRRGRL